MPSHVIIPRIWTTYFDVWSLFLISLLTFYFFSFQPVSWKGWPTSGLIISSLWFGASSQQFYVWQEAPQKLNLSVQFILSAVQFLRGYNRKVIKPSNVGLQKHCDCLNDEVPTWWGISGFTAPRVTYFASTEPQQKAVWLLNIKAAADIKDIFL